MGITITIAMAPTDETRGTAVFGLSSFAGSGVRRWLVDSWLYGN